jgi:hypothetical protein
MEEHAIVDLEVEALRLADPLITDFSVPILIQVVPPKVTPFEHQLVLQVEMATNVRSPHTLIMNNNLGGILPPIPPSPV